MRAIDRTIGIDCWCVLILQTYTTRACLVLAQVVTGLASVVIAVVARRFTGSGYPSGFGRIGGSAVRLVCSVLERVDIGRTIRRSADS